jgi:aspartate-semialdehyde dehydrogenase
MGRAGFRIGLVGATGALATEVLEMLDLSSIPVREIVPVATDRSLGESIDFQGSEYPVETDASRVTGTDLLLLCAPPAVSLEFVHRALKEKIPCIDLSGATSGSDDVPMRVAGYGALPEAAPLIALPPSPTLALVMALQPLVAGAGVCRVSATVLESASTGGKGGVAALYQESLALFNQQDPSAPTVFPAPIAFDCSTGTDELELGDSAPREQALIENLAILLGPDVKVAVTTVQIPVFTGLGAALCVETERDLSPSEAADRLGKAPGVAVWPEGQAGPNTRSATGHDRVIIGRLRRDPTAARGLQLWLVADPLRLAASHAIQLATLRLG